MKQLINLITITLLLITTVGCSKEDANFFKTNDFGSKIEHTSTMKYSQFIIPKDVALIDESISEIITSFVSHGDNLEVSFKTTLEHDGENILFNIQIPKTTSLVDDNYNLSFLFDDGTKHEISLTVSVEDEMVSTLLDSSVSYSKLSGEGSKESPYLINDPDDFDYLKQILTKDANYASDIYFKQCADFTAPYRSDEVEGSYYYGVPFAGNYDGGGYEITIYYKGSLRESKDVNVGLFDILYNGASISNLTIDSRIESVYENAGAIAGNAIGDVTINNIIITGSLTDNGSNVGSLIGYAKGDISISKCSVYTTVNGATNIGGLIGYAEYSYLNIEDCSNLDNDKALPLSVTATSSSAGGVVGALVNSGCTIKDVTVKNSVSGQDSDLIYIYAGNNAVGGIAGSFTLDTTSSFENVQILTSIGSGTKDAGGLVGTTHLNDKLTVKGCKFASYLNSGKYVGGFFGYLNMGSGNIIIDSTHPNYGHNSIAQVENGSLEINGTEDVGGVVGCLKGDSIIFNNIIEVNIPVKGHINVGGFVGAQTGGYLRCDKIKLDNEMKICGDENTGGFIGMLNDGTIDGVFNKVSSFENGIIPDTSSFTSNFGGKITDLNDTTSGTYIGGIVGQVIGSNSKVINLCFTGSVAGSSNVGGIIGYIDGATLVENCVNRSSNTITAGDNLGGIVGNVENFNGEIKNTINYSNISGGGSTAGIIGNITSVNTSSNQYFKNSINLGDISGSDNVGGLVGYAYGENNRSSVIEFTNLVNYGIITSSNSNAIGGVIAYANGDHIKVRYCTNHGNISTGGGGVNIGGVGGIIGIAGRDPNGVQEQENYEVAYCVNRGNLSSSNINTHIGGIAGYLEEGSGLDNKYSWGLHDCYNTGEITSKQDHANGGIIGMVDHHAEVDCCINIGKVHYDGEGIVGDDKTGAVWYHNNLYLLEGTGGDWKADEFSSNDKKNKDTFENFNFSSVWSIDTNDDMNNGYPYLQNLLFQN
ncbi:MAG: hypothetical protein R3Y50_09700 [Rikenellaceae bacterium]